MSLYTIKKYLHYKWAAKTRHGVHSPFVYNFIDKVLLRAKPAYHLNSILEIHQGKYPVKYKNLLHKICRYYNCQRILGIDDVNGFLKVNVKTSFDLILINLSAADKWINTFDAIQLHLNSHTIVAIPNIHKSQYHTAQWEAIYKNEKVKLSIDLFGLGLLFFKEEFKVKQHFVLKY